MKKLFLFVTVVAMSIAASATELFNGSHHVSWDTPLLISSDEFVEAQPGQKIVVTYASASDGIEFKVKKDGEEGFEYRLPGTRNEMWINADGDLEHFLTQDALDAIANAENLVVIGANFDVTKVELLDGKAELKEGHTLWTGYFWADEWNEMYLNEESYKNIDFSEFYAIRFYSQAASGEYILNFRDKWEGDGGILIADQNSMTDGEGYKELVLTEELRETVKSVDQWLIQFNKESIDPFNVTDIVLVMQEDEPVDPDPDPEDPDTGVDNVTVNHKAVKMIDKGQIVIFKNGIRYNALGIKF